MLKEDLHVVNLACVLLVGFVCRFFEIKRNLNLVLSATGVITIVLVCGMDSIYFVVLLVCGCAIIKSQFLLTKSPRVMFMFALTFQTFFNASAYFGLRYSEISIADALLFLASMKIVIVSYEICDMRTCAGVKRFPEKHHFGVLTLDKEPTVVEICCYMTCILGLFTGPLFKFRTYDDMLRTPYRSVKHALGRYILQTGGIFVVYVVIIGLFDLNYYATYGYNSNPFYIRFLHVYPLGIAFRLKYFVVWYVAEISMILVGLGMYPSECQSKVGQGPNLAAQSRNKTLPVEQEFDFETIRNNDLPVVIFGSSMGYSLAHWNRSIQWWLVQFVYRSDLLRKSKSKLMRTTPVFLVNYLWHGPNFAHFIVIGIFSFFIYMDDYCMRFERQHIKGFWRKKIFLAVYWLFVKELVIGCSAVSFSMMDYQMIANMYMQTYFAAFLFPVAFTVMCKFVSITLTKNHGPDVKQKAF